MPLVLEGWVSTPTPGLVQDLGCQGLWVQVLKGLGLPLGFEGFGIMEGLGREASGGP